MPARRWIVIGAGAVGGTIGGRLHQGGADVVLVARGAHGEALRSGGLLLRDPDTDARLPVPSVAAAAEVDWRPGDVAVVATKTHDAAAALDALATAAGEVPVVCATNGVEAERLALRLFTDVHGMCVMLPAAHLAPGVVEASSAPCSGILDVGLARGGHDAVDTDLSEALRAGRFVADPEPDVMRRKRAKLLLNLANVLDAACGPDPAIAPIAAAARAEGVAAFEAAGLPFASEEEDRARRGDHLKMRPIDGKRRGGGSTWQSLARGAGTTEADYLNGEIVLLGREHGLETPVNLGLQRLARHLATNGAPPGSMSPDEVTAWSLDHHA
jgi:2-dehydropantoate 2-reductase